MKLKFILTIVAIGGLISSLKAQYAGDALRFSLVHPGSNARFKAIGNAHTAIGGDLSSIAGNPAGIGLITRSEWSATLEFNNYTSKSAYLNTSTLGSKDVLNINQAAVVFHIPNLKPKGSDLEKGWVSFDIGIGYNRNADFGNNTIFSGTNPNHSIADYFAELATKNYGDPSSLASGSLERMAYDDYLIGYDAQGDFYFPETEVNNIQTKSEDRKGGQSQLNLAFAGNFSNKFYLGLNLGFANIRYNSDSRFAETGYNVTEGSNYEMAYLQNQQTTGKGFNAAIGFIYKPIPSLRLGANLQTPTWYEINDSYTEVLNTSHVKSGLENTNYPETYNFTYRLRTPLKLSLGTGIFLGNMGFISADVDMVDYSTINFRGITNADLSTITSNNQDVLTLYKKTYNYRIGAEIKLESLMLRGGYGIQGNPYKNLADADFQSKTYSAGIGYRIKRYYMDLSYQQVNFNSELKPYTLADKTEPVAQVNTKRNNIFMTFGLRF
jgi:hypothetical protein